MTKILCFRIKNPFSDSKMSVGNNFEQRSKDINHILQAASPQKKYPHPPLYGKKNLLFFSSRIY